LDPLQDFESRVLPHLDAAYNLARWLLRSAQEAEDAVQESSLRALRYAGTLRGEDARPWLLGIVRNTCFNMLERQRRQAEMLEFDSAEFELARAATEAEPTQQVQQRRLRVQIDAAIRALSPALREVIVLRELEGLAYEEIARVAGLPIGTVMSRLSRARALLRTALSTVSQGE